MKISYNWLKQFFDLTESVNETSAILTATGLEVEGIEKFESVKGGLEGLVVGEVITCEKHPNADKLSLTTVDFGQDNPADIVCGAPNVARGQKVIVAPVGSTIYPTDKEEGFKLTKAKIRGEVSEGMICSAYELGISDDHSGILVLEDTAKVGTPARDVLTVESDTVFEIGLTPNRADAASHIGVCRDLKGVWGREVNWPSVDDFKVDDHELPIEVIVEDSKGAPRYSGITISNVEVRESPDWLKNRLSAIGLTPINNVVDITNYVLHSIGQPLHAFDYDEVTGKKVVVKTMAEGAKFTTLDEKERKLTASDLMICNEKDGMCIGGVFGGIKSGVKDTTKNIFLECAYFSPDYIRKTALHHGLKTDASFRYERGTDPNLTVYALKWAAMLIKELADGRISSDIIDIYPEPVENCRIPVKFANVNRLIGKDIGEQRIFEILQNLDIEVSDKTEDGFMTSVPPYRVDVQREADVIEEILRIYGYDNVELDETLSTDFLSDFPEIENDDVQVLIGGQLSSNGFYEIITNSLTKPSYSENLEGIDPDEDVHILNKLSEDLSVLRQSLLPNGLEVILYNINRRQTNLKLFEFGKTYRATDNGHKEEEVLALYMTGNKYPESWAVDGQSLEFHDLANHVYASMERLGISGYTAREISSGAWSRGLELLYNNQVIGVMGWVNNSVLKLADVAQPVLYAELYWRRILKKSKKSLTYQEVPKYPSVRRDLSLVVSNGVSFKEIRDVAEKAERKLLREMNVFSVYEGENIGKDKKAYAISFILQDESQTLKDKQIDNVMNRLISKFESDLGALIRK